MTITAKIAQGVAEANEAIQQNKDSVQGKIINTETIVKNTISKANNNKQFLVRPVYVTTTVYEDAEGKQHTEQTAYEEQPYFIDEGNVVEVMTFLKDLQEEEGYTVQNVIQEGSFDNESRIPRKVQRLEESFDRVGKKTDQFSLKGLFDLYQELPTTLYLNGREFDNVERNSYLKDYAVVTDILKKTLSDPQNVQKLAIALLNKIDAPINETNIKTAVNAFDDYSKNIEAHYKNTVKDLRSFFNDKTFSQEEAVKAKYINALNTYKKLKQRRKDSFIKADELTAELEKYQAIKDDAVNKGLTKEAEDADKKIQAITLKLESVTQRKPSEEQIAFAEKVALAAQNKMDDIILSNRALYKDTGVINSFKNEYTKTLEQKEDIKAALASANKMIDFGDKLINGKLSPEDVELFKNLSTFERSSLYRALQNSLEKTLPEGDSRKNNMLQTVSELLDTSPLDKEDSYGPKQGSEFKTMDGALAASRARLNARNTAENILKDNFRKYYDAVAAIQSTDDGKMFTEAFYNNYTLPLEVQRVELDFDIEKANNDLARLKDSYNTRLQDYRQDLDSLANRKGPDVNKHISHVQQHIDDTKDKLRKLAPSIRDDVREQLPLELYDVIKDIPYDPRHDNTEDILKHNLRPIHNVKYVRDIVDDFNHWNETLKAFDGDVVQNGKTNYERYLASPEYADFKDNVSLYTELFDLYKDDNERKLTMPNDFASATLDTTRKEIIQDINARKAQPLKDAIEHGDSSGIYVPGVTTSKRGVLMDTPAKQAFYNLKSDVADYFESVKEDIPEEKLSKLTDIEDIDSFGRLQQYAKKLNRLAPSREFGNLIDKINRAVRNNPKGPQETKFGSAYNRRFDARNPLNNTANILKIHELAELEGKSFKQLLEELTQEATDNVGTVARSNRAKNAGTLFSKGQSQILQQDARTQAIETNRQLLTKYAPDAITNDDTDLTYEQLDAIVTDYVMNKEPNLTKKDLEQLDQVSPEAREQIITANKEREVAQVLTEIANDYTNSNDTLKQLLFYYIDSDKQTSVANKLNERQKNPIATNREFERNKAQAIVDLANKRLKQASTDSNVTVYESDPLSKALLRDLITQQDIVDYFNKTDTANDTVDADKKMSKSDKKKRNMNINALIAFNNNLSKSDAKDILYRIPSLEQAKNFVADLDSESIKAKLEELKGEDSKAISDADLLDMLQYTNDVDAQGLLKLLYAKASEANLINKQNGDNESIGQQLRNKDPNRTDATQAKDLDFKGLAISRGTNMNIPHEKRPKREVEGDTKDVASEPPKEETTLDKINAATTFQELLALDTTRFTDEEFAAWQKRQLDIRKQNASTKQPVIQEETPVNIEQVEDKLETAEDKLEKVEDTVTDNKTKQAVNDAQQAVNNTQQAVNAAQQTLNNKQKLANRFKTKTTDNTVPSVANITESLQNAVAQQTQDYDDFDDTTGNITNTLISNDLGRNLDEDIPEK